MVRGVVQGRVSEQSRRAASGGLWPGAGVREPESLSKDEDQREVGWQSGMGPLSWIMVPPAVCVSLSLLTRRAYAL